MNNEDYSIDRMRYAIARSNIDTNKFAQGNIWPIHPSYLAKFLSAPFTKDFYNDFQSLKKSIGLESLAKIFLHPSALWLIIMRTMPGLKIIDLDKELRVNFTQDILRMIDILMAGNIFCEDKKNIVLKKGEIEKIEQSNILSIVNPNFAGLIGRLHAGLINYSQSVFWVTNCAHREIHGPYPIFIKNKSVNLIIREYYLLNPIDLMKELKGFPLEKMITYSLYKPEVKFEFEVLNDYSSNLPLNENLIAFGGKVTSLGKEITLDSDKFILEICRQLEEKSSEISGSVNKLSDEEKAIGLILRSYYLTREMRKQMNKNWKPPEDLLEKVKNEGIQKTPPVKGTFKQKAFRFLDLYDPRVDLGK